MICFECNNEIDTKLPYYTVINVGFHNSCVDAVMTAHVSESRHRDEHTEALQDRLGPRDNSNKGLVSDLKESLREPMTFKE